MQIFRPSLVLVLGFVLLILAGGGLLLLPLANAEHQFTPPDVAFFTATSAVTVTGHTVVNTSTYWSFFGQAVIVLLMIVGGLGFMALATFLLVLLGQRSTLPERFILSEAMGLNSMQGLRRVAISVVIVVFSVYLLGAAAILSRLYGVEGMSMAEAAWHSFFLSVAAFNNAGLSAVPEDPLGSGLGRFVSDPALLGILIVLIVLGGISFPVLVDLFRRHRFSRLVLDTKLVVATSCFLWLLGTSIFFLSERANPWTMGSLEPGDQVTNSFFHSASARTAGLSTVDWSRAEDYTKLSYSTLMFIGGASGSMAGGIKVNTFAIIAAAVLGSLRGRGQAEAFGREIAGEQVNRALAVVVLSLGLIALVSLVLTVTEPTVPFLDLLFDVASAFGTCGLSTGILPGMSLVGKVFIMATMFAGKLGPLALVLALAPREQTMAYRFIKEGIRLG